MPPKGAPRGNLPTGPGFFNPERVPALVPKYANKIGKSIDCMTVTFAPQGVRVMVTVSGGLSTADEHAAEMIPLAEFHRRLAAENAPSEEEKLRSLRNKYEVRLNAEFPQQGPRSGSDADIQAFLAGRPFAERRALLMSQKDFDKSYPEGFRR
jgi:hypothetical protein